MSLSPEHQAVLSLHKMEQRANVYLVLAPEGHWVIDQVFVQNGTCDGLNDVDEQGCSCDDFTSAEHKMALSLAREAMDRFPGPAELLGLMIAALYPFDTPPDLTDRETIEAWLADPNRNGPHLT